jgi:two-component system OmpR family response regulator
MSKKRILVVDDELSTTRLLKLGLEKTGYYQVQEENSGKRALAAALEFKPDLILLDVLMPDVDGGDVAFQIQADGRLRHIPIVFLTSLVAEEEAAVETLSSGGFEFIAKPASVQKLVACIEKALGRSNQPRASGCSPALS